MLNVNCSIGDIYRIWYDQLIAPYNKIIYNFLVLNKSFKLFLSFDIIFQNHRSQLKIKIWAAHVRNISLQYHYNR